MDCSINVFAPKTERAERAKMVDSSVLTSYIFDLMSREIEDIDKNKIATYIIHNYEDATNIIKQVDNIDQQIIDKYLKNEQTIKLINKSSKSVYPL